MERSIDAKPTVEDELASLGATAPPTAPTAARGLFAPPAITRALPVGATSAPPRAPKVFRSITVGARPMAAAPALSRSGALPAAAGFASPPALSRAPGSGSLKADPFAPRAAGAAAKSRVGGKADPFAAAAVEEEPTLSRLQELAPRTHFHVALPSLRALRALLSSALASMPSVCGAIDDSASQWCLRAFCCSAGVCTVRLRCFLLPQAAGLPRLYVVDASRLSGDVRLFHQLYTQLQNALVRSNCVYCLADKCRVKKELPAFGGDASASLADDGGAALDDASELQLFFSMARSPTRAAKREAARSLAALARNSDNAALMVADGAPALSCLASLAASAGDDVELAFFVASALAALAKHDCARSCLLTDSALAAVAGLAGDVDDASRRPVRRAALQVVRTLRAVPCEDGELSSLPAHILEAAAA
eukprot:PLAT6035.1.p1 GENE.PLAT6035.1~~PLAT6035.1.p1  ORF type:complete len:423 (+),score=199.85 PLAT6035.1:293-1561(+)